MRLHSDQRPTPAASRRQVCGLRNLGSLPGADVGTLEEAAEVAGEGEAVEGPRSAREAGETDHACAALVPCWPLDTASFVAPVADWAVAGQAGLGHERAPARWRTGLAVVEGD